MSRLNLDLRAIAKDLDEGIVIYAKAKELLEKGTQSDITLGEKKELKELSAKCFKFKVLTNEICFMLIVRIEALNYTRQQALSEIGELLEDLKDARELINV